MTNHSIAPPPELLQRLLDLCDNSVEPSWHWKTVDKATALLAEACQHGADQELEACVKWLNSYIPGNEGDRLLRAARRPKPSSLKEQALEALAHILNNSSTQLGADTIRRALEQLPDLESAKRQSSKVLDLSDLPQWTPEQVQKLKDLLGVYRNHLGLNE